jgi:NACalpha-BTF3-like transcription factor
LTTWNVISWFQAFAFEWANLYRRYCEVEIDQADVALIVAEIKVEKKAAEMRLREHGGDVGSALRSYV